MLWKDTKRHFGLPTSFTRYELTDDRLFLYSGLLVRSKSQTLLYHIRDINVTVSLFQRIFGVGTITITGADASHARLKIENIKNVYDVAELLNKKVEEDKERRNVNRMEMSDI